MRITFANGLFAQIDDADYPLVSGYHWYPQRHRHTWYAIANVPRCDGTRNKQGRARRTTIKMHRVILNAPVGVEVDHDDGNGLNNSRRNIKLSTRSGNQRNQHAVRSNTGVMGVYVTSSGKFVAQLIRHGRHVARGTFATLEEAAAVREQWRRQHDDSTPKQE